MFVELKNIKGIKADGCSLNYIDGKNVLASQFGEFFILNDDETNDILRVHPADALKIHDEYVRIINKGKIKEEILKLSISSHAVVLKNDKRIREINEVIKGSLDVFFAYINKHPKKAKKYIYSLKDMIVTASSGDKMSVGNIFGAKTWRQKLCRLFFKNKEEDRVQIAAKRLWRNIIQNQEIYRDYICEKHWKLEDLIRTSDFHCQKMKDNLYFQTETLNNSRLEREKMHKLLAVWTLKNYVATKRAAANPSVANLGNVIDFQAAVDEIRKKSTVKEIMFMNA